MAIGNTNLPDSPTLQPTLFDSELSTQYFSFVISKRSEKSIPANNKTLVFLTLYNVNR